MVSNPSQCFKPVVAMLIEGNCRVSLYKNRYRIESIHLKNWDYSSDGFYYITVCTKDRQHIFGDIINGKMLLSAHGEIVKKCWVDLPDHYINLILDVFVIMPNHIHGIMIIDNDRIVETGLKPVSTYNGTRHGIFEFIRAIKTFSSKRMNKLDDTSGKTRWQSRFYDHIIRNEKNLTAIREYIENNPTNWEKDDLYIKRSDW